MSILALGRKQKKGSKKRKFPIKEREKAKEKRKKIKKGRKENSRSRIGIKTEEICRKVFGLDNILTIQNCHQVKERKPRHKVVLSL